MSYLQKLRDARTREDVANLLGFKPSGLAYIVHKMPAEKKYISFEIPKRSGGMRKIDAPTAELRLLQRRLAAVLYACREEMKDTGYRSLAHGFERGRSIITNASLHRRRRYVLNLDLENFFPSFNFGRVRGFFIKDNRFALDENVATLVAQIACHDNALPQGGPCSPVISNLICHLLDARLARFAKKHKCTYSRYADDITFSTSQKIFPSALAAPVEDSSPVWGVGAPLLERIEDAGFQINSGKTRMQYRGSRQVVTGLLVNEKVNIRPEYYRTVRAMCHALFSAGEYYRMISATLKGGSPKNDPVKISTESLDELEGMLSHIYSIKRGTDWGRNASKRKSPFEKTVYARFLFYKYFVALDAALIVPEGKTDSIYLRAAIRKLKKFHPQLGQVVKGKFSSNMRFLNCSATVQEVLQLGNGTGSLPKLIEHYTRTVQRFRHAPLAHPVILLIDNDDGASSLFKNLKKHGITHASKKRFYHLGENLYLVKTPEVGSSGKSRIEDMFDLKLLKTVINGKSFDPDKERDADGTYGKFLFATKVVRPNIGTIDFSKFAKLLVRIVAVLKDYEKRKAA